MRHILTTITILTILLCITHAPAHAQTFDPEPFLGEHWYGMYMNGAKIGYSVSIVTVDDDGLIHAIENDHQPFTSVQANRDAMEMIQGVWESTIQGGRVQLPLKNRTHPLTRWI